MKYLSLIALPAFLLAAAPVQAARSDSQGAGQTADLDMLFEDEAPSEPSNFEQDAPAEPSIPSVDVFTLDNKKMNLSELKGSPVLIHFWATYCTPCMRMMSDLQVQEDELEGKVKVVFLSIDDRRSIPKVAPTVETKGLSFDILLDPNSDAKRALGVVNIPATFLFDAEGKQVLRSEGYTFADLEPFFDAIAE